MQTYGGLPALPSIYDKRGGEGEYSSSMQSEGLLYAGRPGEGAPLPLWPFPPSVAVWVAAAAAAKLASFVFGKFCNKPTADEDEKKMQ